MTGWMLACWPCRWGSAALLVVVLIGPLAWAQPVSAQVPDTTRTDTVRVGPTPIDARPADTTQAAPADTVQAARPATPDTLTNPLPLLSTLRGTPVIRTLPTRDRDHEVARLLTKLPGSFLYDLGGNGWPHGWSWEGLNPQRAALLFDGHPYDDPVTGRPRFDLLPPAFLQAPCVGVDHRGGPVGVYTQPRLYDVERPLTELRYRRDNSAMQSVGVAHIQQREVTLLGTPSLLQVVGGYYGRAADNEYPNSDLRRERRLLGRVALRGRTWSLTLRNLHSRRRIGAHGGVEPTGGLFGTVYNRTIANVRLSDARRQTLRNDLALTARAPVLPGLDTPLTASINWTAQTTRYDAADSTLHAKTNRLTGYVQQSGTWRAHTLQAEVGATYDGLRATNAWTGSTSRKRLYATVRDSIDGRLATVVLDAGLHATGEQRFPSAAVYVARSFGPVRLFAEVRQAGQPLSWIETAGFGDAVQPLASVPTGRIALGRLGMSTTLGPFDLRLTGFAHEIQRPVDLYATGEADVLAARVSEAPFRRAGVTAALGWRRDARAGLYATAQGTTLQFLQPEQNVLSERAAETLPQVFGQGRLGARFIAFEGDLNADLYVTGRGWTRFRSRQFHPPTGLLAVPPAGAPVQDGVPAFFGPSGTMDVTLEAGIREATLFFTMENVLSGTPVLPGTLIVPVYPLPEQRFRFGVFWPILN